MVNKRERFRYFGKVPLCNHRADRGIFIHGFCLPLCFRCTGLLAGSIAGTVVLRCFGWDIPIVAGLALIVPTGVDGFLEYFFGKESMNRRRMVTGLMAGVGCAVVECAVERWLGWG